MTVQPAPVRRSLPRGLIAIAVVGVFVVSAQVLVLIALGVFTPPAADAETTTITVADDYAAFTLDVPDGTAITTVDHRGEDRCDSAAYHLSGYGLEVEAVSAKCELDRQRVSNGRHGTYRTIDDVPEPKDVATLDTGIGPAEVFTQEYVEATNSTDSYEEPVAIVVFDDPVNPDYPTLVIRSEKGELGRGEFIELVESLAEPNRS